MWVLENRFRGANLVLFVLWVAMLLFWIPYTVLMVLFNGKLTSIFIGIFICLVSVYKLILQRLMISSAQYKMQAKAYGENWTRTIEFQEDCILITDGSATFRHPYSFVTKIKEKGNKIWFYCENKAALRLYKDKFVDGTWEECRKLMEERNEKLR